MDKSLFSLLKLTHGFLQQRKGRISIENVNFKTTKQGNLHIQIFKMMNHLQQHSLG